MNTTARANPVVCRGVGAGIPGKIVCGRCGPLAYGRMDPEIWGKVLQTAKKPLADRFALDPPFSKTYKHIP